MFKNASANCILRLKLQNPHIYLLFLVESLDVFVRHNMRGFDRKYFFII